MTQNTIDLAIAASNLNSPSDTASPGNTGICGGKPPFGKSLQEAMQTTDINDGMEGCDAEQFLPPAGQELPLQSAYNVGLEGITEVRALTSVIPSKPTLYALCSGNSCPAGGKNCSASHPSIPSFISVVCMASCRDFPKGGLPPQMPVFPGLAVSDGLFKFEAAIARSIVFCVIFN